MWKIVTNISNSPPTRLLLIGVLVVFFFIGIIFLINMQDAADIPQVSEVNSSIETENSITNDERQNKEVEETTKKVASAQDTSPRAPATQASVSKTEEVTKSTATPTTAAPTAKPTAPEPEPIPITNWELVGTNPDRCSGGSEGDKIYCPPGWISTFYAYTTNGTTIKDYYTNHDIYGSPEGVTITLNKVSSNTLKGTVVSDRTQGLFNLFLYVTVNELAETQEKNTMIGWFSYLGICLRELPASGCANK